MRKEIGGIATPDMIICTNGLPKTRSGKIMRRVRGRARARPCAAPAPRARRRAAEPRSRPHCARGAAHGAQILRKIACGEADQLGDVSTLADPSIVPALIAKVEQANDPNAQVTTPPAAGGAAPSAPSGRPTAAEVPPVVKKGSSMGGIFSWFTFS